MLTDPFHNLLILLLCPNEHFMYFRNSVNQLQGKKERKEGMEEGEKRKEEKRRDDPVSAGH